jgi:putative transposase
MMAGKKPTLRTMPDYRRYYVENSLVFITCVTYQRQPHFGNTSHVQLLFDTMRRVQAIHPFRLLAYSILPEHFHWLMRVDEVATTFSTVMHGIKRNYVLNLKKVEEYSSGAHVWQDRFWDHVIRDETDFKRHFDYIHWNPVKHHLVQKPEDWPHSTYRHWLEHGYYEPGWGWDVEPKNLSGLDFD